MRPKYLLAHLAVFAAFLVSFSVLVHALPSPDSSDELITPGNTSLLARANSPTDRCKSLLVTLKSDIKTQLKALDTCADDPNCDPHPILDGIAKKIQQFIDKLKKIIDEGNEIQAGDLVNLFMDICSAILELLKAKAKFTAALCAKLAGVMRDFVNCALQLIGKSRAPGSRDRLKLQMKSSIEKYRAVCLKLGFNALLKALGIS